MANVTFKRNRSGVMALLKCEAMQSACMQKAQAIAARCGEGYVTHPVNYPERRGAAVAAATIEAARDNSKNNTILKNLE